MDQTQPQLIRSERQRQLQQLVFANNTILSRDIPRDSVYKHLQIRMSGSIITTFASGTPLADSLSSMDNLVPRIDVVIAGSRTVKNVRPHLLHMQQLMTTMIQGERAASAGAAPATDNFPTTDGAFVYGTTGQYTTVRETVLLSFENVYARVGKDQTWLNLKGQPSAEIRLTCGSESSLLAFGNTAPVVYSADTFVFDIFTTEQQDVPATVRFLDWKQTTKEITFSSQTTDYTIDINRGNRLQAIAFLARDGAAGSATTATGKLLSNLAITNISLVVNGSNIIKKTTFKALQAENRIRFGISAPFASGVSRFDGYAYMDLLSDDGRGDLNTALNVMPPLVDNVQLLISTNTSANVSYTNPVSLTIMTEELVNPQ